MDYTIEHGCKVVEVLCRMFSITPTQFNSDLRGRWKGKPPEWVPTVGDARQVMVYYMHDICGLPWPQVVHWSGFSQTTAQLYISQARGQDHIVAIAQHLSSEIGPGHPVQRKQSWIA